MIYDEVDAGIAHLLRRVVNKMRDDTTDRNIGKR